MDLVEISVPDFDLAKTLESGQVFHWEKIDGGFYGTLGERAIYLKQTGDVLLASESERQLDRLKQSSLAGARAEELAAMLVRYFALDHPLAEICRSFPSDPAMSAARDFCRGLRIIRQPKWECLATFICSSMKQVVHIRQISHALRRRFGQRREIASPRSIRNVPGGSSAPSLDVIVRRQSRISFRIARRSGRSTIDRVAYTFPHADRIARSSEKELRRCALGYRAKNLLATARLVANGDVDLEKIAALSDPDLREQLCELPGVGAKVANCVMLFAYERLRAFPIDVWIERVLREQYFPRARKLNAARLERFTQEYFGEHGGYAQQYLFHHARMNKNGKRSLDHARNDKKAPLT